MSSDVSLPELPSIFTPVLALREAGDAMARAVALAPAHGAGTLVWVRSSARIEAAVVLEPEEPLRVARCALYAAASAIADALAAFGPPEVPLTFRWPGAILVNGGEIGRARLAAPAGDEAAVPPWLVVGVEARLRFPRGWEPGQGLHQTALEEEGWDLLEAHGAELTAAWARHLMAGLDEWQARGFRRMAERYLARLEREAEGRHGLDPATGDLVAEQAGARSRRSFSEALA